MARVAPLILVVGAALGAGCGPAAPPPPDGGPPVVLDVVGRSDVGLQYGATGELRVRLHTDDAQSAPIAGQPVRFSITRDPGGSTLSRDQAVTDANGIAGVTVTAGQAEVQFKVNATTANAPDVTFSVAVSKLDFVNLDVQLSWPTPGTSTTLRALLYDDHTCAVLPAALTVPVPLRADKANASFALLSFDTLLSRPYAIVGRAEDVNGALIGYGCVDIGAELVPPGSQSTVPLPLTAVVPSPVGTYALTSLLLPAPALANELMARWREYGDCRYGAAQMLLDRMGVTAMRDPVDSVGCRPLSTTSLDRQLQDLLLAPPMAPASLLDPIVEDLAGVTTSVSVKSLFAVSDAGGGTFMARHTLQKATFSTGGQTDSWSLVAEGLPVIDVANVAVTDVAGKLTVGAHSFTFGWHTLWKLAFEKLSLMARVPGLGSPAVKSLVTLVVQAASRNGKTGCAAVEDLLCSALGSCTWQAACTSAIDQTATYLEELLAPSSGLDLTLAGSAATVDSDRDLQVDLVTAGSWSAPALQPSTFSGARQ